MCSQGEVVGTNETLYDQNRKNLSSVKSQKNTRSRTRGMNAKREELQERMIESQGGGTWLA